MKPSTSQLRILIVDDHEVVRAGLRMLIDSQPGMKVVAMASNRKEALEAATRESPDLILLDLDLGGENALTFLTELKETAKNSRVLILTGLNDSSAHRRSIKLGAMGVVLKDQAAEVLIKAIRKVHSGEVWIDRAMVGDVLTEMTRGDKQDSTAAQIDSLTDRELQVIKLVAEGLRNKQIGERLYISETTVTHHLSSIFSKLGVSDRLELVIFAFGHNLARVPQP
ncbi:MAG TPA: response regulator transcription factor [Pyrinomonadaceae bacterium]|nr:response regulator transcription factor [Pyrinomonadaceae bacterium]